MMMGRRSSFRNSSTSLVLKKSAAAPKPTTEVTAATAAPLPPPPPPATPLPHRSQSTRFTQAYNTDSYSSNTNNNPLPPPAAAAATPLPHRSQSTRFTQAYHTDSYNSNTNNNNNSSNNIIINDNDNKKHGLQQPALPVVPKKAAAAVGQQAIIEFPVSPGVVDESQGITNPKHHPQHRMVQIDLPSPFSCSGCKDYGAGPRFTCLHCNFELHDFCALAPPVLKAHPLHSQHHLVFNPKPGKGGILRSKCDVCGKAGKGYLFQCSACSFQLHPCCAMLSPKMKFPIHPHSLVLLPASAWDPADTPCAECKKKRSGQVYQCTVCDYYLHAVCAKTMVNGLHANGIKGLDKPSMLGVAAKIASHVVAGFMGGIIEGIGEGLGEALSQNLVKGRCNSTRRDPTTISR